MKPIFVILFFLFLCYIGNAQTRFIWPVASMPSYSEVPGFYVTNNYVDSNNGNTIQDYNCGSRTYSGHRGIDIDLWPFTWSMMDNNYVAIVAAAPGRIVAAIDNLNNEDNCGQAGANLNWNYIAIRHADSSTSIYGHIRTNSSRVTIGQFVTAGQIIAFVGSSGNSSNPHLHFEVNSTAVTNSQAAGLVDPYAGPCNNLNMNTSWWAAQKPYREPAVVRLMTHGSRPQLAGYNSNSNTCRGGEVMNAKAEFAQSDSIYFGVAIRDMLQNQSYSISVFYPNGGLWFSESFLNNFGQDLNRNYRTFHKQLPNNAASGTWQVVVNFNGVNSIHFFSVNCPSTQNVTGTIAGTNGYKTSATITSTATVNTGNRLFLQAGSKITLSPGFSSRNGSILKARIRDCNYIE